MSRQLYIGDYYLLGLLLKRCAETLGKFDHISQVSKKKAIGEIISLRSLDELVEYETNNKNYDITNIGLTEKGLEFCLENKLKILRAVHSKRAIDDIFDVVESFDRLEKIYGNKSISSWSWTGLDENISISEEKRSNISSKIYALHGMVEDLNMSQYQKSQAKSMISAALILTEAPDPLWKIILEVLALLAGFAAITSAITDIVSIINPN